VGSFYSKHIHDRFVRRLFSVIQRALNRHNAQGQKYRRPQLVGVRFRSQLSSYTNVVADQSTIAGTPPHPGEQLRNSIAPLADDEDA